MTDDVVDWIRAEADLAARAGQYDRLNKIAGEVARLLAEVRRLREGIEALAESGEADGRGNSRDLSRRLRALLDA